MAICNHCMLHICCTSHLALQGLACNEGLGNMTQLWENLLRYPGAENQTASPTSITPRGMESCRGKAYRYALLFTAHH